MAIRKIKAKHKTFKTMLNNQLALSAPKNYEVIDQFFAAQVACNESEETLKALRPQVEEAVQAHPDSDSIKRSFRIAFTA